MYNIASPVFSVGKRPKHVLGQMVEVWCLMFIPFCYVQQVLRSYILHNIWAFLSMMVPSIPSGEEGAYVYSVLLLSPLLETGVCAVRMGIRDGETHPELSVRHQPSENTGLNICWKLSCWVTALQMYRILYSTSWPASSLVLHLVKNSHMCW